jgi:hypothetical protein
MEAPAPEAPLQKSRIKSDRELQTFRPMVGGKKNEWGSTRIWHGQTQRQDLLATMLPFFLFSTFAGMVPPFSPFLRVILVTYDIQAIHLHPKSVTLLAVFAYACEAWVGIKHLVAYFRHLFACALLGKTKARAASPSSPRLRPRRTSLT